MNAEPGAGRPADPPADARPVRVAAERLGRWLDNFADRHGGVTTGLDPTGTPRVLVTAADGSRAWIDIPFPPLVVDGDRLLTSLALHAKRDRRIGVLLVRRGGYAAGVFDGATLVSSKVGSSYVQGTTKAGGWSQQRYARRRSNQSRAAFAEAADVAARILLPAGPDLDALFCGGDRTACREVLADVRLTPLAPLVSERVLDVPDPRLKVLQATPEQFRSVSIAVHP
ncbi:MAG: hypothetical protein JWN95_1009 [Frankiales bacterium]|nr:hypothetical protein [Frankiales bacterium]